MGTAAALISDFGGRLLLEGGVFEKEHILRSGFVYGSLLLIICVSGLIAVAIYSKESAGENANV